MEREAAALARLIVRSVANRCAYAYTLGLVAEHLAGVEEKVRASAGAAYLDGRTDAGDEPEAIDDVDDARQVDDDLAVEATVRGEEVAAPIAELARDVANARQVSLTLAATDWHALGQLGYDLDQLAEHNYTYEMPELLAEIPVPPAAVSRRKNVFLTALAGAAKRHASEEETDHA